MAAEEPICPECGKPLLGRDRFEGTCAACREEELLGERPPAASDGSGSRVVVVCAACGAGNPEGLTTCLECDAKLHPRRVPVRWCVVAAVAVLGLAAWLVATRWHAGPRAPRGVAAPVPPAAAPAAAAAPPPPPPQQAPRPEPTDAHLAPRVRQETHELLALLRKGDYERVIDNYCQPDEAEFARVERVLEEVLHGDAAAGLARWSAVLIRLGEAKARDQLREAGDPQPAYTVALLTHLARAPWASGSRGSAEDRARGVLRWHLAGLFEGLDLARAEVRRIDGPGAGAFVVEIDCGGTPSQPRPGDDPRRVRWARLPVGWVVRLALAERLDAVHEVFKHTPAP